MSEILARYFSESETAAELHKDIRTLQRWRASGVGPTPTHIGNTVYYGKDALRAWVLGQAREPGRVRRAQGRGR
jgi:hypothetical protein